MNLFTSNLKSILRKNTQSLLIIPLLFGFINLSNAASLKVNNGFESGNLSGIKCSGNCPTVTTSTKVSGKYSGDFSLTQKMRTNYRTEATLGGIGLFDFGKEYWLGLDYFYKDWKKDSNAEIAPFQIHARPSAYAPSGKGCHLGSAVSNAPFLMVSSNDEVRFLTYGRKVLWRGSVQKKQWLNITVHFRMSFGGDGFVEAWKDGVKLGRVNGPNSPKLDKCGKLMRAPYFKMGIYKWDWKRKNTDSSRREIFIDNVKIAEGSNGYSLVNSLASAPSPKPAITRTPTPKPKPAITRAPTPKPTKAPVRQIKKDITPPVISNIQAAVTGANVAITWNTNKASNSYVQYGLSSRYNLNKYNGLLVTSHKTTLKNLIAGKVYHYTISSKDSSGNRKSSSDLTFTVDPISKATKVGLVAHWPMDKASGTAIADISGNRHTGKLINGAHLLTGEGIRFDGVNDYLDAGNLNVGGNAMTMSAWFWADDLNNCRSRDCRILSKASGVSEQDHYFMVSTVKAGNKTRLRFRLKTNGRTSTLVATSGDIVKNEWVHVTASYDGKTMRLYKDGVEIGSKAKNGSITTNSKTPVWIGGNPKSGESRPWKGHIGDVRIYNYALVSSEISQLANAENLLEIDKVAPKISKVQVAVTDSTAVISWNTNEASNSIIKGGLSHHYDANISNDLLVTNHKITVKNLESNKKYHYQINSADGSNNTGYTGDLTFTTEATVDEDLVAHWSMETGTKTTVDDVSGHGHTGKLRKGAGWVVGEGINFDGINDYVDVGKLNISGNAMTLSAWFWSDDLANCKYRDCRILSKATGVSEQDHYFMISTVKAGNKTRLRFRLKTNGRTSTLVAASGDIVKNQWVHVTAVYDGQTMRLYKDGVEVGSRAKRGNITTNSKSSVWIGGNPASATSRPWKGHIGDVRLYSYPLTNHEIRALAK